MLEKQGVPRLYKDGDVIFKEGSYGEEMYIVNSGHVEIFRAREKGEVSIAKLGPKDFFGELAFFGNFPRSASARAYGEAEVFIVNKDVFMKLINDDFVWLLVKKLGDRIRETDDKIEDLIIKDHLRKEALSTIIQRHHWT